MKYKEIKRKMPHAFKIPYLEPIELAARRMTLSEKLLVLVLAAALALGAVGMLSELDTYVSTRLPTSGGSLSEAIIGTPRFINPLLALTDSDRDLVMLTYSGLMRATTSGGLVPDMAKSYTISEDGQKYTFILKENLTFHDGKVVTADDVLFTILAAQDPLLKSIKRAEWDGVQVEKTGNDTIVFTLSKPYAPFLENTTLGILPKHLWENVKIQEFSFSNLNIKPIGSGPYMVDKISYNKSGIPKSYALKAFKQYALGMPHIRSINLSFLNNKEELIGAWETGTISAVSGISLEDGAPEPENLQRITYPRIFAVFFNQDKAKIFASKHVRSALSKSIDKKMIIDEVMGGYASPLSSAIPPDMIQGVAPDTETATSMQDRLEQARKTLEEGGWEFGTISEDGDDKENEQENIPPAWRKDVEVLEFTLATANTPELTRAAEILIKSWRELGIRVRVDVFEANELNQNVVRARDYDALLFGEVVGRSLDLFAFWHSSQRDDPGLNIALYANAKMDKLLESARTELDEQERNNVYKEISVIMESDIPAIFLYSPDFIYILPQHIKGVDLKLIATPSERFAEIHKWYMETNRVWNIFAK